MNSIRTSDSCLQSLKALQSANRARGVETKVLAPSGLLRKEVEVSLSEAAARIADGKDVTLREDVKTSVEANVSILAGWRTFPTEINVTQQLQTPISGGDELQEFADFRSGHTDTDRQKLAGQLLGHESGQSYDGFHLIAPAPQGLFGGAHKAQVKLHSDQDERTLVSLSSFASARFLQEGKSIAVATVDDDGILNDYGGFDKAVHSQFASAPSDLESL